ncbi:MAG: alanine racemase [Hyphomicrobiaceae bacterium]|nr:alanine racemase [Hyphomicrobiaceae bacterium]
MSAVPPSATGIVTIDLRAIQENWRALAERVRPAECGAVVKADAYGLGAERVIPALAAAGCRSFFVATPQEAAQAMRLAAAPTIYVLDGLLPGAGDALIDAAAIPVLSDIGAVREWAALAARRDVRLPAALQLDSGLNRLGLSEADVMTLAADAELFAWLDLKLVMSHLACADDPDDAKNAAQLGAFRQLAARLLPAPLSLAASDGLMLGPDFHFDLVRPGYALYGGQAFKGGATPVRPVVRVEARVLQVRDVGDGETVGYSATFSAKGPRRIATIAAGYADGLFRHLSAGDRETGGSVSINGHLAPIAGRVSMDLITVDVTDVPGTPPQRGDLVCVIGDGLPIEAVGAAAGTIGYEVLTSLGRRFHRIYLDGDA